MKGANVRSYCHELMYLGSGLNRTPNVNGDFVPSRCSPLGNLNVSTSGTGEAAHFTLSCRLVCQYCTDRHRAYEDFIALGFHVWHFVGLQFYLRSS